MPDEDWERFWAAKGWLGNKKKSKMRVKILPRVYDHYIKSEVSHQDNVAAPAAQEADDFAAECMADSRNRGTRSAEPDASSAEISVSVHPAHTTSAELPTRSGSLAAAASSEMQPLPLPLLAPRSSEAGSSLQIGRQSKHGTVATEAAAAVLGTGSDLVALQPEDAEAASQNASELGLSLTANNTVRNAAAVDFAHEFAAARTHGAGTASTAHALHNAVQRNFPNASAADDDIVHDVIGPPSPEAAPIESWRPAVEPSPQPSPAPAAAAANGTAAGGDAAAVDAAAAALRSLAAGEPACTPADCSAGAAAKAANGAGSAGAASGGAAASADAATPATRATAADGTTQKLTKSGAAKQAAGAKPGKAGKAVAKAAEAPAYAKEFIDSNAEASKKMDMHFDRLLKVQERQLQVQERQMEFQLRMQERQMDAQMQPPFGMGMGTGMGMGMPSMQLQYGAGMQQYGAGMQ